MNKRNIAIKKAGLEGNHPERMHTNKEMPTGQRCSESSHTFLLEGRPACVTF